jgi:ABC-2 type transport system ATP-binding protein
MEPVIETRGLTKSFRGKMAVRRLNLSVPRGAIFAFLGDNGAGKSTTIRMLTGLLRPDAGQARILGQDCWIGAARLRQRVGYVPEKPKFYDWMSVNEIGWFTSGFHAAGFMPRYTDLIHHFDLDPKAKLQNLSKGQYSKAGLALALAADPDVLILDEPTSGLDLLVRREFLSSMVEMAGEGRTILISSHQISEVERIASHVAFMAEGRLILSATMDELRQRVVRYRLRYVEEPPDAGSLGVVLQRNGLGKMWEAVIKDPNPAAVEKLRFAEGIHDFEEAPLALEEAYCALLTRKEVGW